jgi:hypothetical protein
MSNDQPAAIPGLPHLENQGSTEALPMASFNPQLSSALEGIADDVEVADTAPPEATAVPAAKATEAPSPAAPEHASTLPLLGTLRVINAHARSEKALSPSR